MYFYIIVIFCIFLFHKFNKDLRLRFFASFVNCMTKQKNEKVKDVVDDLFKSISDGNSSDPELRKRNALKILEIGVGTGMNFRHYPDGTKLTVIDPNPHFEKFYNENRKKFPNIQSEDIIVTTGEEMDMVKSESIDVVVVTHVLCCVTDAEKVCRQVMRVLAPGGRFYFFEHVKEFEPETYFLRSLVQEFLTRSGIFPFLMGNCHLTRLTLPAIKSAGFSNIEARNAHLPFSGFMWIVKSHLLGVATK